MSEMETAMKDETTVDVLAVGAHPDDVEIGVGGFLHKLTQRGHRVAILDLSQGEMSTRGAPEERAEEARQAAEILGVSARECAELPDGAITNTTEEQRKLVPFLRKFRPRVLLANMAPDRHPDHTAAHYLVRDANFFAGLARIDTGQAPYRAPVLYFYHPYYESEQPHFIIDVSDHFEAKLASLRAHASQFHNPDYEGEETLISSKSFWDGIVARAAHWGARAGFAYGEALHMDGLLAVDLPPGLTPEGTDQA